MDNDVAAGSSTTTFGHLALGLTLLAFGLGHTGVIDGVSAGDAASLATYVGGLALFVAGLLSFRDLDEALAGAAEIDADWPRHSRAARALAEEHLDSARCLPAMLAASM